MAKGTGMTVRSLDGFVVEREEAAGTLSYDGEAGSFAGIAITNTLLSLVTLGFYRFWGKTRLRRYLWSRISLAGDRLEYVGWGKELFIGFCIAMLVLIPLMAAPLTAELLLAGHPIAIMAVQLLQFIVIIWLIQVAMFRARRYRLSRTKWRGIRAGQTGSAVGYAFRFFGWMVLSLVTLFLAYPWARTALQRYRVTHSWFGNQQFSFKARGGALLAPWLLAWLPLFFALVIAFAAWLAAAGLRRGPAKSLAHDHGAGLFDYWHGDVSALPRGGVQVLRLLHPFFALPFQFRSPYYARLFGLSGERPSDDPGDRSRHPRFDIPGGFDGFRF